MPIHAGAPRALTSLLGAGLLAALVTPAAAPVAAQAPTLPAAPATARAGAAPLGSTSYPVPVGAVVVAPSGSDNGAGTEASPLRTVAAGLKRVKPGGTVVLRGGTYHEAVVITKKVTLQGYPGEAVWLDGAQRVTGWTPDGNAWRVDNWTAIFDTSPTFTKGAPDNKAVGWRFVNPEYPMAAHPDQVWIDGTELKQVGSRGEVGPGTFYVDRKGKKLFVGDNPTGKRVEAGAIEQGISVRAPNVTVRGLGVRRYSNPVPSMGAVVTFYPNSRFENLIVEDNATVGLGVYGANAVAQSITSRRNGLLGANAFKANNLTVINSRFDANNDEHFNRAPTAGGLKVTKSRPVRVTGSVFSNTNSHGLWLDESVHNATVTDNDFVNNTGNGMIFEISSNAVIANNVSTGNGRSGIRITNSDNLTIWNNTLRGNARALDMAKDNRDGGAGVGHDKRYPAQSWMLRNVSVGNNILQAGKGANATLAVENYDHRFHADDMNITSDGNIYLTSETFTPRWQVVWARAGKNPWVYTTLAEFQKARGKEKNSVQVKGGSDVAALFPRVARPVPAKVTKATRANLTGKVGAVR